MKDNVLEVLMFLYDNFLGNSESLEHEISIEELQEYGFMPTEIFKAFDWLENLAKDAPKSEIQQPPSTKSFRIYVPEECEVLNQQCRGFLQFLEYAHIIDPYIRELVVEQILGLETGNLSLEQMTRIILMVLFNQAGYEASISWLELYLEKIPSDSLD